MNMGVIGAGGGGTLALDRSVIDQRAGGTLFADSGVVSLTQVFIIGGTVRSEKGGVIELHDACSLDIPLNEADLRVVGGNNLIERGFRNEGSVRVGPTVAGLRVFGT